jgi:hypothetical protein
MKRALATGATIFFLATTAHAEDDRAACVQAADTGQNLRDQGKLESARTAFLGCARASCPRIVADKCTQWLAGIATEMPTVSFRALDASGKELIDVTVYVDSHERLGTLDGKSIDLDPGVHTFRFVHAGLPDLIFQAVLRAKEKDRVIEGRFKPPEHEEAPEHHHPFRFPWTASLSFTVGILSFIGMGVSVGTAANDANHLRVACAGFCAQSDVDWIKTRILIGNIAMGVGIAGMSLFTLALVVANVGSHTDDDKPAVSVGLGPGSIGISGRF